MAFGRRAGLESAVLTAAQASTPPLDFQNQMGWVLIALQNAFFHLRTGSSFVDAVVSTISGGGDTDTNAAIVGALLGAVEGREAVPSSWRRSILTARPVSVGRERPVPYWPVDALELAERLVVGDSPEADPPAAP